MKKERGTKSQRINDFQSEWICQKPSALFTLPLSAHGEPESLGLPAQGEMGRSGSPVCTSGSQLEKEGWGRKERRGGGTVLMLNFCKDMDDRWKHQLNMFCISEHFLCLTSEERREVGLS